MRLFFVLPQKMLSFPLLECCAALTCFCLDNPDTASQEAPAPAHKGTIGEIPVATEQLIQRLSLAEIYHCFVL